MGLTFQVGSFFQLQTQHLQYKFPPNRNCFSGAILMWLFLNSSLIPWAIGRGPIDGVLDVEGVDAIAVCMTVVGAVDGCYAASILAIKN